MPEKENDDWVGLEDRLTAATFDTSCRPQFYRRLPSSTVYAGFENSTKRGLDFFRVKRAGSEYVAVFTSEKMIPAKCRPVRIMFSELLELVAGSGVSLNPGQPVTKDFSESELQSILNGSLCSPEIFEKSPPPAGHLAPPSKSRILWKDLSALLKDHPGVEAAWSADFAPSVTSSNQVSAWVGISAPRKKEWVDAAQECTILLNTLDETPSSFKIEEVTTLIEKASPAICFYKKSDVGGNYD